MSQPTIAPTTITTIWPSAIGKPAAGQANVSTVATNASVIRGRSGQRLRAIPQTACATTATATHVQAVQPADVAGGRG
jgi:hypothetical protein